MKMTFQPKKRQRSKVHGFRARMNYQLKTADMWSFLLFAKLLKVNYEIFGIVEKKLGFPTGL